MKIKNWLGSVILGAALCTSAATLAAIDKIIVFGDSLSDNGNVYNMLAMAKNVIPLVPLIPKNPPYYEGRSKQEAYERYFQTMIDCVKAYDFVDSLGHIDYIARYAPYADPEIYYHDFSDAIHELLSVVVQKNIALEINTRRFDDQQVIEHLLPIYQKFHDLGGKYVTLGSDAHRPTAVASHLQDAWKLAQRCGLQAVYYEERQRKLMTE